MDKTHVPYPGCYCADCVEGTEPIGYINAEMLNRKGEFEANGMVMFDRPCGAATMPLYAEPPSARITGDKDRPVQSRALTDLTTRLHSFAKALEAGFDFNVMKHLDVSMCCDGHMCGCQGSTVGQYLAHQLRGELPEEKLTEANRQLAIECHRLRSVLRWIADTGYVDHQSGNQNFEHLQSIARDAITKEARHG